MHILSCTAVVALASLRLIPAVIAVPWTTSDSAPVANGANAPRGLQLLDRDYSDDDVREFHLKDDDDHQVWASIERTFSIINDIPDEVLQKGDDATHKWLTKHGHRGGPKNPSSRRDIVPNSRSGSVQDLAARGIFDVVRCVGAITAFIASNAIGAAKIFRIKKYIEALGGVRASAKLLLKASNNMERLKEGGEALALLAGEILGVPLIANNC